MAEIDSWEVIPCQLRASYLKALPQEQLWPSASFFVKHNFSDKSNNELLRDYVIDTAIIPLSETPEFFASAQFYIHLTRQKYRHLVCFRMIYHIREYQFYYRYSAVPILMNNLSI